MIVYIYGLKDPETKEIRYVGKANNPKVRYHQHVKGGDLSNSHKRGWIDSLAKKGLVPELVILEVTDEKRWETREKHWIKYGLNNDWPLTNISAGGACYPSPLPKRYCWDKIIWSYLPPEEWEKFKTFPEEKQLDICHKTAMRMMEYSWIAIKERGGNPAKEYSQDVEYWAGSDMARELVAVTR